MSADTHTDTVIPNTNFSVIACDDLNQDRMVESSKWKSYYLRKMPDVGVDSLMDSLHTFQLRGKQYVSCFKDDERCRIVTWLGQVGRRLSKGWCLLDDARNWVEMSPTFAKYVGVGDLFGQPAGGFTYYRELSTDEPTQSDWIKSLSDKIAELEGYNYGDDYNTRVISPLRKALSALAA